MYAEQGICKLLDICGAKYWPDGSQRVDAHFCRASTGEKAKDHLGEQVFVRAAPSYFCELCQSSLDLGPPLFVNSPYVLNGESCAFKLCHLLRF